MSITRFIVRGHSMRPAFRQGDILALAPAPPETIRRGQVIVFRAPDRDPADWVVHRVIRVTGNGAARQGFLRRRAARDR
jgi:signal peptidase I